MKGQVATKKAPTDSPAPTNGLGLVKGNHFVQVGGQHGGVVKFLKQPSQMANKTRMNHLQKGIFHHSARTDNICFWV